MLRKKVGCIIPNEQRKWPPDGSLVAIKPGGHLLAMEEVEPHPVTSQRSQNNR